MWDIKCKLYVKPCDLMAVINCIRLLWYKLLFLIYLTLVRQLLIISFCHFFNLQNLANIRDSLTTTVRQMFVTQLSYKTKHRNHVIAKECSHIRPLVWYGIILIKYEIMIVEKYINAQFMANWLFTINTYHTSTDKNMMCAILLEQLHKSKQYICNNLSNM